MVIMLYFNTYHGANDYYIYIHGVNILLTVALRQNTTGKASVNFESLGYFGFHNKITLHKVLYWHLWFHDIRLHFQATFRL